MHCRRIDGPCPRCATTGMFVGWNGRHSEYRHPHRRSGCTLAPRGSDLGSGPRWLLIGWGKFFFQREPNKGFSDRAEDCDGSGLAQRLVSVAALGRLNARGTPVGAWARTYGLQRGTDPLLDHVGSTFGEAGTARDAVVDEDRGGTGVGVELG